MWYRTAKINYEQMIATRDLVATCIVFRKNKDEVEVLLERRGTPPHQHKWCIPGGHIEKNEKPVEAAVRELKEESHLTLNPNNLIYIGHHDYELKRDKFNYMFATEYKGNETIQADSDAEHMEWVNVKDLPVMVWNNFNYVQKAHKKIFNTELPTTSQSGLLIVFEGMDGAGKSSQMEALKKHLSENDETVITTKWSDGDFMAQTIKKFKNKTNMEPKIYSLIHATDLLERYEKTILPALNLDKIVLSDRYYFTSMVRDKIRGVDIDLDNIYGHLREPDIIFYCKAPIEDCIKRASERGELSYYAAGMDLNLDTEQDKNVKEYYNLMNKHYDDVFKNNKKCHIINTDRSVKSITEDIIKIVEKHLNGD
jgi:dTMP kinase